MKILQVINDLGSGGAEKLIADFVPLVKEKGYEVEVLSIIKENNKYIKELEGKKIKVTCLSNDKLYSLENIFTMRKFIKNGNFDIVHVHLFPALYYAGISALLGIGKSQLVYTEHSTYNRRREYKLLQIIDNFFYKKYKAIIAVSKDVKKALVHHLNYDFRHINIIYNGVDITKYEYADSININEIINTFSEDNKIICMVSRISKEKEHATLIKAISLLPDNIILILVGDGPLENECVSLSQELNLNKRVFFLGFRSDIPNILKGCDIGVLSSNWEGLPVFALEVFASGIPFIGSNVPGIKDLFIDVEDKELFLFKNKDSKELSKLILRLLNDKRAKEKNIKVCKHIVSKFSLEKMTDSYIDVYRNKIKENF